MQFLPGTKVKLIWNSSEPTEGVIIANTPGEELRNLFVVCFDLEGETYRWRFDKKTLKSYGSIKSPFQIAFD